MAINLIPVAPLDGAEAWKLPGLLVRRRRARRRWSQAHAAGGFAFEREAATLARYGDERARGRQGGGRRRPAEAHARPQAAAELKPNHRAVRRLAGRGSARAGRA